ncbi:four helix bundle protein [Nodosilinea sp. LEGE 07088]|uniref:four helix bundle protein n=1 Tax=Nodosilinea sp. LEGE 07088 TaxID=2777968 RepID=UPI00187FB1AE|nr:four helix bundle protein [Nodosilinea sp. LEGE 07088]MBE9141579.1 four helix bundle protein [Nodosilinea sp. LEGE 07088]
MQRPTHHVQPLQVYQMAFQGSVAVARWAQPLLETSEVYLIQQFLATSQAVCAHLADAWGQRQHRESFIAALSTAQLQAAEMQTWIEAAIAAGYLAPNAGQDLYDHYRNLYTALDQLMATASTTPSLLKENAETPLPVTA